HRRAGPRSGRAVGRSRTRERAACSTCRSGGKVTDLPPGWRSYFFSSIPPTSFPPLALQSAALMSVHPCPLHAFFPAQACPPPAQAPWPLHAFTPPQWTLSPPAFSSARADKAPVSSRAAAALAMRTPVLMLFMSSSLECERLPVLRGATPTVGLRDAPSA